MRRARSDGPRHVAIHGREKVVVISEDEFRRRKGDRTGAALIEIMRASPHRAIGIAPERGTFAARDVIR